MKQTEQTTSQGRRPAASDFEKAQEALGIDDALIAESWAIGQQRKAINVAVNDSRKEFDSVYRGSCSEEYKLGRDGG